ncbi:MAG: hypothetical protein ACYSSI_06975 [Planctomycetota bacterium]|jgi:hypothetical protein
MGLHKNFKIVILLIGLAMQGFVISSLCQSVMSQQYSQLTGGCFDNVTLQIAGEIPEAGTILLLGFGSLWLRKKNHKNKRKLER